MLFIEKPKHWYTREITLNISVWPKWLAQWLCPHENMSTVGWQEHKAIAQCQDCYKTSIVLNSCTHPMECLVTDTTIDGTIVMNVPNTWHCSSCGQSFTREMQCPECDLQMEITEHTGMFSARFLCTQCGVYHFREDL